MIGVLEVKKLAGEDDEVAVLIWHYVACVREELPA
jgi:hypothetical protein